MRRFFDARGLDLVRWSYRDAPGEPGAAFIELAFRSRLQPSVQYRESAAVPRDATGPMVAAVLEETAARVLRHERKAAEALVLDEPDRRPAG